MNQKDLSRLFSEAKKSYRCHPFFSVLIPVISSTKIVMDDSVRTASIRWQDGFPLMSINRNFCDKYVKSPEDVLFLLSHEICHFVYGHLLSPMRSFDEEYGHQVTNLALDIIIDQILYRELGERQREISLIRYYKHCRCPMKLMVPPAFLDEKNFEHDSCKELCRQLKTYEKLTPYRLVQHIATHESCVYIPIVITYGIDAYLRARIFTGKKDTFQPLVDVLMSYFACNMPPFRKAEAPLKVRFMDAIRELYLDDDAKGQDFKSSEGPIPFVGRRDLMSLAVRKPTLIYHGNPTIVEERGLKVYFDVSGSMAEHIPKVLALLDQIRDKIFYPLYAFSVGIFPVTRGQLLARQIISTGGTDFNILAEHIIRNRQEKVLLITDGQADISEDLARQLKRNHKIITVLSASGSRETVERMSRAVIKGD